MATRPGATCASSRAHRRPDHRPRRPPRLRPDACRRASSTSAAKRRPRTSAPARRCSALGDHRLPVPDGPERAARGGRAVARSAPASCRPPIRPCRLLGAHSASRSTMNSLRLPPVAAPRCESGWSSGVLAGVRLGRDYRELDDCLLLCCTEQTTPGSEIERSARHLAGLRERAIDDRAAAVGAESRGRRGPPVA